MNVAFGDFMEADSIMTNGHYCSCEVGKCDDCEEVNIKVEQTKRLVRLDNPHLSVMKEDVLYHLALATGTHNLQAMFSDVKFVCVGGSARRMEDFAQFMLKQIEYQLPAGQALGNISGASDRYAMYKVGPVLAISHGIGISSFSVMMHELIKALHYAKATDVCCFRLGTSGGLGLEPGTVVVSEQAVDGLFRPYLELHVLGKISTRPATLDSQLVSSLMSCARPDDPFKTDRGKTMCTSDFYEGQARLDGAFCEYSEADKMQFLREAHSRGVRNIEMESLCFAAMCQKAKIRGAVVCVTLLDRLHGDQVSAPRETLKLWEERPATLVSRFIRNSLGLSSK